MIERYPGVRSMASLTRVYASWFCFLRYGVWDGVSPPGEWERALLGVATHSLALHASWKVHCQALYLMFWKAPKEAGHRWIFAWQYISCSWP